MQLGVIGLGRMGGNIARRLMRDGHQCVVWDQAKAAVDAVAKDGATGGTDSRDLVAKLDKPRAVWVMLPAGPITEQTVEQLSAACSNRATSSSTAATPSTGTTSAGPRRSSGKGHPLCRCRHLGRRVGAGARLLHDDRRRRGGGEPARPDLHDAGARAGRHPPHQAAARAPIRAPRSGYIHAGPPGAGHFVKMVHNGIEYGMMQAYAEGFDILREQGQAPSCPRPSASTSTCPTSPRCGGGAA